MGRVHKGFGTKEGKKSYILEVKRPGKKWYSKLNEKKKT